MKKRNIQIVLKSFLIISIILFTTEFSYGQDDSSTWKGSKRRRPVSDEELAKINAELREKSKQMDEDYESGEIMGPRGATAHDDFDDWGDDEQENYSGTNDEGADSTGNSEEENDNDRPTDKEVNSIEEPPNLYPTDPNNVDPGTPENINSLNHDAKNQIVCASAKTSFTEGSEFKRAKFTIGGSEPQEIEITSSAENFAIVKEYGGLVYQVIDGLSWGSTLLEPGTYILSCNGGGAMGLMSATVCIKNPMADQVPPPESMPTSPRPDPDNRPTWQDSKPQLPKGPIEKIFVRPAGKNAMISSDHLTMLIDEEKDIAVWGKDAAGNMINVIVDDWTVYDDGIGSIIGGLHNPAPKDSRAKITFKAGDKKGYTRIKATVINKENRRIDGVLFIEVTEDPTITITGCVKLFDEDNNPLYSGGVKVYLHGRYFTSEEWDENIKDGTGDATDIRHQEVATDNNGKYKFTVATGDDVTQIVTQFYNYPPAPLGYKWMSKRSKKYYHKDGDPFYRMSNSIAWTGPSKEYKIISMVSKDFECLIQQLEKMPTSIIGKVTHRGRPVEGAQVEIANTLISGKSDENGLYGLNVGNLPKGRYQLTAKYHSPRKGEPGYDPNTTKKFTMHQGWLYIDQDKWVDLPLQSETLTINVDMVSFGKKIGYTGP